MRKKLVSSEGLRQELSRLEKIPTRDEFPNKDFEGKYTPLESIDLSLYTSPLNLKVRMNHSVYFLDIRDEIVHIWGSAYAQKAQRQSLASMQIMRKGSASVALLPNVLMRNVSNTIPYLANQCRPEKLVDVVCEDIRAKGSLGTYFKQPGIKLRNL